MYTNKNEPERNADRPLKFTDFNLPLNNANQSIGWLHAMIGDGLFLGEQRKDQWIHEQYAFEFLLVIGCTHLQ